MSLTLAHTAFVPIRDCGGEGRNDQPGVPVQFRQVPTAQWYGAELAGTAFLSVRGYLDDQRGTLPSEVRNRGREYFQSPGSPTDQAASVFSFSLPGTLRGFRAPVAIREILQARRKAVQIPEHGIEREVWTLPGRELPDVELHVA